MATIATVVWLGGGAAHGQQQEPLSQSLQTRPSPPTSSPTPEEEEHARRVRPDDKRRTLRSYGSNLAYNLLGVVTRGNHRPLLATAAVTAPVLRLDDEGVAYFRDHPHRQFGRIGRTLGGAVAVTGLTLGFFSAGRMARGDRFRAMTYDISQAIIVNQVYTLGLKLGRLVVRRKGRPPDAPVPAPSAVSLDPSSQSYRIGLLPQVRRHRRCSG